MFKRYLFSTSAAVLIAASPALAGSPAPAPVEPVIAPVASTPAFSWNGGYAGLNLGYGGDKAKHLLSEIGGPGRANIDITSSGFAGGAQVGWNFQNDGFVYGVEADYQASGIKGEVSVGGSFPTGKIGTKLEHFGTLRARLGYTPTDRFLVYGTAGFASGKTKTSFEGETFSKTKGGWTAGIGAEYAFTDQLSLKSEYLYTDLGTANLYRDVSTSTNFDRKFNFHMVRVGINYHF